MNPANEFEEFVRFFKIGYYEGGRDREELIRFLKRYPNASLHLSDEIIEHLETPSKRYLYVKKNVGKDRIEEAIYGLHFRSELLLYTSDGCLATNVEWNEKSYDVKCYELSKLFPKYTLGTLKKETIRI